jgi:hypothetical protein
MITVVHYNGLCTIILHFESFFAYDEERMGGKEIERIVKYSPNDGVYSC